MIVNDLTENASCLQQSTVKNSSVKTSKANYDPEDIDEQKFISHGHEINTSIEMFNEKSTESTSIIEYSDSNENHSIVSENMIISSLNESEDSFEKFTKSNIQISRPFEQFREESKDLIELRTFMSTLEDDLGENEELLLLKKDNNILSNKINDLSEQFNIQNSTKDDLESLLSTISDDSQQDITDESSELNLTTNEINKSISRTLIESKFGERKRFSIVNTHSIPLGIKISHLNCSSTYIYICTNDKKIFYAKLNINQMNAPLEWKQHFDLAEQLIVSFSNRKVWRLCDKRLYSSNNPMKFPPIGSQWTEIKIDNEQSFLSVSINDQCGWYV